MPKHLLKTTSYVDGEAFIYCPTERRIGDVKIDFPLRCPLCHRIFPSRTDVKFVLEYPIRLD